jgi:hypothetical protein
VLLVSGYEQQTRDQSGQTRVTDNRLTKPYTLTELAKRVRDVMDDVSQDG